MYINYIFSRIVKQFTYNYNNYINAKYIKKTILEYYDAKIPYVPSSGLIKSSNCFFSKFNIQ